MKILKVGGGGRELALALHLTNHHHQVWCAGASDAIAQFATALALPDFADATARWEALAETAKKLGIDLTIVGPEAPLATGITDVFEKYHLAIFAPTQAAARIETSKAYAKEIMAHAGVPTARYRLFTSNTEASAYLSASSTPYPAVLKENGLRAGKGVTICTDSEHAMAVAAGLDITTSNPLLVEEFLEGFEFSLIVMAAGDRYVALPVAQDHKPIGEGNTGPNTGGMGAVSPVPRVNSAIYRDAIDHVIAPTLAYMKQAGNPFTGFLYAGLIATAHGVKVIEFNARLGDPEAEVILPRLDGDLAQVACELLAGRTPQLAVSDRTCLGIVLSSPGYPGTVTAHPQIPDALLAALDNNPYAQAIHMGTQLHSASPKWQAAGGRVLIATVLGTDIADCRAQLLPMLASTLSDSDLYYRTDIGTFAG
ncbi:MAG: phosphoribosylamine--glycine ligase [Arcanobacterium sp.]|nr:phosphoribosylamine--glycine ligase [Arcanobacterium sp.]